MKNKTQNSLSLRQAFTLVEVMLSVALTVILLIGVNFIFSTSANAVSAGNAVGEFNRASRGAQPVLFEDLNNVVKDAPFIIMNRARVQFLNAADAQGSTDVNSIPIDNKGTMAPVNPALYGQRSHRVDILQFCAHSLYQRRTTDDNAYSSFTFGNDTYVHIGHGKMPANDLSAYYGPDDSNAPQTTPPSITGAYASDWTLNHTAMLFKSPNNVSIDTTTYASPGNYPTGHPWLPEVYYPRQAAPLVYAANLTPVSWQCFDTTRFYPPSFTNLTNASVFGDSRYDMVGCTLEQFKQICGQAVNVQQASNATVVPGMQYPLWCSPLLYSDAVPGSTIWDPGVTVAQTATAPPQWDWLKQITGTLTAGRRPLMNRFNVNPTIQAPLTAAGAAEISPFFIQHCSQFLVEYAGDYLKQAADGSLTGAGSDGQVDFWVDKNGSRHIRWYGLPRKTTLDPNSGIRGYVPGDSTSATIVNRFQDVIPLSDYLSLINGNPATSRTLAPFEVDCNFLPCKDYSLVGSSTFVANNAGSNGTDSRYVCAWYNTTPAMIRILIKVDDPNNSVQDGPWYEYIFQLK